MNAERALREAYEILSRPVLATSCFAGAGRAAVELNSYECHAQAANLIHWCERSLPALHLAYVRLQFGRDPAGLEMLCHQLAANYGAGIHSRKGIEAIIRSYCGEKIGLRQMRQLFGCGMLKAVALRNRCYDALDAIHTQAMDRVSDRFKYGN